jgi:hypothetical protein
VAGRPLGVVRVYGQLTAALDVALRVAHDRPGLPGPGHLAGGQVQLPAAQPGQPLRLLQLGRDLGGRPQRLRLGLQPGEQVLLGDVRGDQGDRDEGPVVGAYRETVHGHEARPDRQVVHACALSCAQHQGGHREHRRRQPTGRRERAPGQRPLRIAREALELPVHVPEVQVRPEQGDRHRR